MMKSNTSFAEILQQKMSPSREEMNTHQPSFIDQDPAYMAYLLGQTPRSEFRIHTNKAYPQKPKPPHVLTEEQSQAFEFFQFQGAELPANFSQLALKKAFRRMALKLHPDRGGSAEVFMALKAHHETLSALFNV